MEHDYWRTLRAPLLLCEGSGTCGREPWQELRPGGPWFQEREAGVAETSEEGDVVEELIGANGITFKG